MSTRDESRVLLARWSVTAALFAQSVFVFLAPGPALATAVSKAPMVRWEGAIDGQASRIIVRNLENRSAAASLGSSVVSLSAEGLAEIPVTELAGSTLGLQSDAHLLVLQVPNEFDTESLEVDRGSLVQSRAIGSRLAPAVSRPTWMLDLRSGGTPVRHGATGAVDIISDDDSARVEVAVDLVAPHSSVRIRQLDAIGNEATVLVVSSSRPVRWRALLSPVGGRSRVELQTLRGEAQGLAAAVVEGVEAAIRRLRIVSKIAAGGGFARFEPTINWQGSSPLYFRISAGPPNLCGDLWISRNGAPYSVTPGWICTDASGAATRGPWTYAGQSGEEDATAYIVWSNGLSTNSDRHIWDKSKPVVVISPSGGSPAPTSFQGTGYDSGSGFSANFGSAAGGGSSYCAPYFYNTSTSSYWCPGSGYINSFPCNVSCTISGMPSKSVTWNVSQVPPGHLHQRFQCYEWGVYLYDNAQLGQGGTLARRTFCVP